MKVILINDNDCRALVDKLKLTNFEMPKLVNVETLNGRKTIEQIAEEIHGQYHYVVVRWFQDQGANLIR